MPIKIICSLLILTVLSACASTSKPAPIFISAKQQLAQQSAIDRVGTSSSHYHFRYGSDPALEQAFSRYLKSGKAPNIVGKGFVSFAYSPDQEPVINTAPLQETVISLQPGEKFENISSGDPSRWSYAVATSGQGILQQQHILVKPSVPGTGTNMVITTNKRIYNLRLVSVPNPDSNSMRTVRFWYPQEMQTTTEMANDQSSVADIALNQLNFDYRINSFRGSLPSWTPKRVFDDGTHTYIQFPSTMATKDMPVLFVLRDRTDELVNYRYQAPYFVVDKIFKQAVLILGVGRAQTKLLISNKA
ncbi:MAG: P-type conjugative transfer protein TrbG [Candidatus Aquirickettsiella sp.]